jgi:hypothetical protein
MPTKVKELAPHRRDDDPRCPICHPKPGRITESELWSRKHLGWRPKRADELPGVSGTNPGRSGSAVGIPDPGDTQG